MDQYSVIRTRPGVTKEVSRLIGMLRRGLGKAS